MTARTGARVVALARSSEVKNVLVSALASVPGLDLEVEIGELANVNGALISKLDKAEVLLLDLALHDDREQAMLHRLVEEQRGRTAIIVTGRDINMAAMRHLMRQGIADCLPQPLIGHEVADAVTALRRKLQRQRGGERPAGKLIGVMRAKGGAGASMLAINLAVHLRHPKGRREPPKRVCLIDLDLQFGDLATMLDLPVQGDMSEIIRAPERLDSSLLHTAAVTHASGLQLLAAPIQTLPLDAMSADTAARLLEIARDEFDYVVVDLPLGLATWTESVLVRLDQMLLVTQLNVPAIRQARRFLDLLNDEGMSGVPVAIVVNRYAWRFGESGRIRQSENALGRRFDFYLHDNAAVALDAVNRGVPLEKVARRSRLNRDIGRVAAGVLQRLATREVATPVPAA